ncbi:unnamed protein product, partial [Symbiodinium microadriaticum]
VFTLADRFLLPRLARLCEVFLSECTLRSATVVPVLASGACWDFLEEHWKEVVQHTGNLEEIISDKHPLVLELLQASRGMKRPAWHPEVHRPHVMMSIAVIMVMLMLMHVMEMSDDVNGHDDERETDDRDGHDQWGGRLMTKRLRHEVESLHHSCTVSTMLA